MSVEDAIKKWEKTFKRKMSNAESTMFQWGFVFGVTDAVKKVGGKK